jgi:hypothetical protein
MRNIYTRSRGSAQEFKLDPKDRETIEWICQEQDQPTDRTVVRAKQIAHLRKIFEGRHGDHLTDTETERKHLLALLRVMAAIPRIRTATLVKEVQRWAPWISNGDRSDLIDTAKRTPRVHRKEALGCIVGLVDAERQKFKAWSIWPIDLSRAESKLRTKEYDLQYSAERRRAAGARPQSESLSRTKPWVEEGISRTEWYNQRKAAKERAGAVLDNFVGHIKEENTYTADETVQNLGQR